MRKGVIPKIPGLRRKEFKNIKNNISKELDLVLENEELDTSPLKNLVSSFGEEHQKIQVAGMIQKTERKMVVNSSTEFQNSNPQNGSEQDVNNGPYMDDHNFSPVNIQLDLNQNQIISSIPKTDENYQNMKNWKLFIPNQLDVNHVKGRSK